MTRKTIGWMGGLATVGILMAIRGMPEPAPVGPPAAMEDGELDPAAVSALQRQVLAMQLAAERGAGESPDAGAASRVPLSGDARRMATADLDTVLGVLATDGTPSTPGEYDVALERLTELVRDDDHALQRALALHRSDFGGEPGSPMIKSLLDARHDDVVSYAVDRLRTAETPDDRDASLELLEDAKSDRADVREALLQVLDSTPEPEPVLSALRGLRTPVDDPVAAADVIGRATRLAEEHPEDEIRRQSYFTIGRWATDPSQLDLVLAGLEEPTQGMRVGAVAALGLARVSSPEITEVLLHRMRSEDEHIMMRDHARRALLALPVSAQARAAAERFTDELRTQLESAG